MDEGNRKPMTQQPPKPRLALSMKVAVIVIAIVEAIAMVPLILYLINK